MKMVINDWLTNKYDVVKLTSQLWCNNVERFSLTMRQNEVRCFTLKGPVLLAWINFNPGMDK